MYYCREYTSDMHYCKEYTGEICITVENTQVKYILLYRIYR